MLIRKLDPQAFVHAYNVDLLPLYPWDGVVDPPFGAAWAVLAPGESTKPHAHQECETFFVARGRGVMAIGDERAEIDAGDVTFHPPFDNHVLTNTGDEDLLFLTVYWEDRGQWETERPGAAAEEGSDQAPAAAAVHRVMVTAAPPTPNGDLHLGHLSGPYLSADTHARYLRLRGLDAVFACGTDDNSPWVAGKGREIGLTPAAAADRFAGEIAATLEAAGIDLAIFPRADRSVTHREVVQRVLATLHERGDVIEKEVMTPWCERCERQLFENRLRGRCPHCDIALAGNTCEDCGWIHADGEMVEPRCTACGTAAVLRPQRRLVFPIAPHAARLREYYRTVDMPTQLRAFCEEVLVAGPPEIAATQPGDWGLPVPVAGFEDQRIYVWFEIGPRYLAYAEELARGGPEGGEGWERYWKSPAARVVQFFGVDNSFYYAVFIPALLLAYDPEIRLPEAFVTNELYRLDGEKFSTSRDHRILGRDLLGKVPADAVRFYLARTCPEREETSFTLAAFIAELRGELVGSWQDWLADLGRRMEEDFSGTVPATGDWTGEHRRFFRRLEELFAAAGEAYQAAGFSVQRATVLMGELVREARRFGRGEVHWRRAAATKGEERRTGMALELLAAKLLGLVAAPVMPAFAERLWRALGYPAGPGAGDWDRALEWVPAGARTASLAVPIFPLLAQALEALEKPAEVVTEYHRAAP